MAAARCFAVKASIIWFVARLATTFNTSAVH
jgi:hypothetical protein